MNEEMNGLTPEEEEDELIELVDEDGNTQTFEWLASFPVGENQYIAVAEPMEDGEEPEEIQVLFLRIEEDEDGNDVYIPVEDDAEADAAFAGFLDLVDAEEDGE